MTGGRTVPVRASPTPPVRDVRQIAEGADGAVALSRTGSSGRVGGIRPVSGAGSVDRWRTRVLATGSAGAADVVERRRWKEVSPVRRWPHRGPALPAPRASAETGRSTGCCKPEMRSPVFGDAME
ncbi:hypothetical protein GCM10022207_50690 [Streptomyces lannensis]|uniref:Uncharacterized protein n=1 Tax=Streptomyces lannensis TaxID=766498 RepID=A0ABP7KIB3_9ACTN